MHAERPPFCEVISTCAMRPSSAVGCRAGCRRAYHRRRDRAVRRQILALAEVEPEAHETPPLGELPSWREADRLILDGYDRREAGDGTGAVRLWLAAWASFLQAMDESHVDDFDDSEYGYVSHWASNLANEIWDGVYEDRQSIAAGLHFTTAFVGRFETHEGYVTEEVRRVHGLLHARAGRVRAAAARSSRSAVDGEVARGQRSPAGLPRGRVRSPTPPAPREGPRRPARGNSSSRSPAFPPRS